MRAVEDRRELSTNRYRLVGGGAVQERREENEEGTRVYCRLKIMVGGRGVETASCAYTERFPYPKRCIFVSD